MRDPAPTSGAGDQPVVVSSSPTIDITALAAHPEYRALAALDVLVDLRYASARNLLGRDLYSPRDCAYLHRRAAEALQRAAAWLAQREPAWRLLVLDAARPQRVQEAFWAVVAGTPMQMYFAPPARGSIHSFGMAVDITLADATGAELDMGTPFDDTSERSHPALEHRFEAHGGLSAQVLANRRLLRRAMAAGGFEAITTEWWHFDFGDRDEVRRTLPRIV